MGEFLQKLFYSDFMGHGYCYLWKPEIVRLHAASDGLIALSYYFIPLMLVYLVRKRRDLPFHWMFVMFGIFILGCGTTHLMEIWTLWHGTYRLAGVIKAITAGASLATAVALVPLVPRALMLPSQAQLQFANLNLQKEVAERRRVEEALQAERNFVQAVLNTVSTMIIVIDMDGRIVECNWACEQMAGRPRNTLAGKHVRTLFFMPEQGEQFHHMVQLLRRDARPGAFESKWSSRTSGERVISWTTATLPDSDGQPRHSIVAGVDITESKRLQKAVLDISAREERRIGQDLHDGLGQQLTGIAFMSKVLEQKLSDGSQDEAVDAHRIVLLVNEAISKTRELSRGLHPVESDPLGLISALERWSGEVEKLFGLKCRFNCEDAILIHNEDVATHMYRIAQEAVNNAIKHGKCSEIDINLEKTEEGIAMSVVDNGIGLPEGVVAGEGRGLGLRIMNYRAKIIGGSLQVGRGSGGGTAVTCRLQPESEGDDDSL